MPFFLIVPIWALCVVVGVVLLFSHRFRFLSLYLLLGSTSGLLLLFLLSLALLFLAGKFLGGSPIAWLALVAYLVGLAVGGAGGVAGGLLLARRINRRMGWQ